MASPRAVAWIERLIWTLIYGGMFTAVIGLATRSRDRAERTEDAGFACVAACLTPGIGLV